MSGRDADPGRPADESAGVRRGPARTNGGERPPEPTVEDLIQSLETLEEVVDDSEEQREVREAMRTARDLAVPERETVFGRVVRGFDRSDLAEALVGSVLFGIPMLVEGARPRSGRSSRATRCRCSAPRP